jgi:hypothetical protein
MVRMAAEGLGSDTDRLPKVFTQPGIECRRRYIERLDLVGSSDPKGERLRLRVE